VCSLTLTRNIKLTIEYDGTAYHGWQSQKNTVAVQDVISSAICRLTDEKCSLTGSSRTDRGVHAFGQVASFKTESQIPAERIAFALNSMLPEDIVIKKSEEVDMDFHARFCAKGKTYKYLIYNFIFPSALLRYRAYHVSYPLDVEAMKQASQYFLGTHDFFAFSATGSSAKTTVRTINSVSIRGSQGDGSHDFPMEVARTVPLTSLEISGDGFLYNMVRIIAGTLIEVGSGKIKPTDIAGIIDGRDRKKAGKTAPAHGLYLVEVNY